MSKNYFNKVIEVGARTYDIEERKWTQITGRKVGCCAKANASIINGNWNW